MKTFKCILTILCVLLSVSSVQALQARLATEDDINLLKRDILDGRIKVGITRLKQMQDLYGEAPSITKTGKKWTYDYGDLQIEFDVKRYLRKWEYDYSHKTAYSDEIESLRFDLEDQQIVGDFYTLREIRKDYDEPTEAYETDNDGDHSVYYYGEIRLTFENFIAVRSIRGDNLDETGSMSVSSDTLISLPRTPTEEPAIPAVLSSEQVSDDADGSN